MKIPKCDQLQLTTFYGEILDIVNWEQRNYLFEKLKKQDKAYISLLSTSKWSKYVIEPIGFIIKSNSKVYYKPGRWLIFNTNLLKDTVEIDKIL